MGYFTRSRAITTVDDPYHATNWNGSVGIPSKNAIRDKIESMVSGVFQPLDAELTAIAGLASGANKVAYFTGSGTAALADFTSVARTLVAQTTQSDMRTTGLGLGTIATQNLASLAAVTMAGDLTLANRTMITEATSNPLAFWTQHMSGDTLNSPFRWAINSTTNPSANPRDDVSLAFGYNVDPSAVAFDLADHAFGFWLEAAFGAEDDEQVEWYMQGRALDGTIVRPLNCTFVCADGATTVHIFADSTFIHRASDDAICFEVDGNGISKMSRSGASEVARVINGTAGGIAGIAFYNDGNAPDVLGTSGSTFVGSPFANNLVLYTDNTQATRDICLMARGASARIRFMTGGTTERIGISSGGLLQFAGTSSSEPAIKRSTTLLQARLADDSDFATYQGKLRVHANAAAETPTATHTIRLFDAAGTEYKVLCVAA